MATLNGGTSADTLIGFSSDDILQGLGGNDILEGGDGNDTIDGGTGRDRASYASASGGVTVNLTSNTASGAAGNDILISIEDVTGSVHDDTLIGNSVVNTLDGGGGADTLRGEAGNDVLNGGAGNDTLIGGAGADTMDGGADADVFKYESASESTSAIRDVINNFVSGTDKIDLSAVSSVLSWGGTTAGINKVWYTPASGYILLRADTTGDGVADVEIRLNGITSIASTDILGLGADVTPPAAPVITNVIDSVGSDTLTTAGGEFTDDKTVGFTGTAEPGTTLTVYDGFTLIKTLTVSSTGNWSFTTASLVEGVHNLSFYASDGPNTSSATNYTFTIDTFTPTPVITSVVDDFGVVQGSVTNGGRSDDTALVVNGTAEAGATVTLYNGATVLDTVVAGPGGTWSIALSGLTDGTYNLRAKAQDTAGYTSPLSSTHTVTIDTTPPTAVNDTNGLDHVIEQGVNPGNTPFAGDPSASSNVITNDLTSGPGDTIAVSAVNGSGANVGVSVAGLYGSVTIAANGAWTYTLDNGDAQTQALTAGETGTDTFAYTVVDLNGATATANLTITITGANDAPVAVDDANTGDAVVEAGVVANAPSGGDATAAGNVLTNDTDVDAGDTRTVTAVTGGSVGAALGGTYGSVTISSDGSWSYALDNADAQTQALSLGEVVTDVFSYTMADADGATATANLTITITGANDAPVAADDDNAGDAVVEAGVVGNAPDAGDASATGNVLSNDTDVDAGDSQTVTAVTGGSVGAAVSGMYGAVTINADGSWSYTLDNADAQTQALSLGEVVTDVFSYTMADADGATATANLTITITGANDAPVAADDDNAGDAVVEAGVVGNAPDAGDASATGNVLSNDTDVDAGDSQTVTAVTGGSVGAAVSGMYGAVTINADGSWSYTLDNADAQTQALSLGEVVTDVFSYTMADADGATATANLTITITGANDAPVAADDDNAGDAVVEAGVVGNAPDAGDASATGNVLSNDTDVDAGDSQTVTAVTGGSVGAAVSGMYGAVTINADGSWSYTLDNADAQTQALSLGEVVTDVFSYTMADADGATATANLTITITGANDAPVAADDDNAGDAVVEAGVVGNAPDAGDASATGNVLSNDTDVDAGDSQTVTAVTGGSVGAAVSGMYGAVTINADGSWSYTLDNADAQTQALSLGEVVTDVFSYTMADADGATATANLTITITGANDAPVAADDDNAGDAVVEAGVVGNAPDAGDASATGNVLSNDTDVDAGDSQTVTAVTGGSVGAAVSGIYGAVTINADGSWSYALDNADAQTQALSLGEVVTDVFSYTMADADGATATANLTITITGANDAPVAADDDNAGDAVVEAGVVGNAPDAGDASATGNVLSNDTDVDAGDSQTVTAVTGGSVGAAVSGMYGAVTINADGSWSYALDNADAQTQALSLGEVVTDVFSYTMADADGATATANLTITITGANDAPVAADDDNAGDAVVEAGVVGNAPDAGDASATGNVLSNDTDVDAGDSQTVTAVTGGSVGAAVSGMYGAVTINADGSWSYALDNADAQTQALSLGEVVTDVFSYTMADADGATATANLTITITGANDAPVAADDDNAGDAVVEAGVVGNAPDAGDASATGNVLSNDTDVDAGDSQTVTAVTGGSVGAAVSGMYGAVTINADGSWSYTLDNADAQTQALSLGEVVTDVFSYTMADADGATATANLTITITGANDAPVAADDDNAGDAVVEAGVVGNAPDAGDASATGNVLSNDTDVDAGDSQTVTAVTGGSVGAAVSGMYGAVTINADGSWSYALDNADAQTQALSLGEVVTDVFSYTMADADGATATANLTITITGANDAPVAADDDNAGDAVVEAGVVGNAPDAGDASATGNVLSNDTDVDAGDSQTVTAVTGGSVGAAVSGMYGAVTINADGSWSYTLDNADAQTQALSLGEVVTDVFSYTMADADGATATANLTITITGANDAPVAADDDNAGDAVVEAGVVGNAPDAGDASATGNVLSNDTDVDAGDSQTVTAVTGGSVGAAVSGIYGAVTINADGSWSYALDNADAQTQALSLGEVVTDVFSYTMADADGATATANLTITITGANDAPVAADDDNAGDAVVEAGVVGNAPDAGDASATGNVLSNDTDVDAGDSQTVTAVTGGSVGAAVSGMYGAVTINADGSWSYALDNADAQTQALSLGEVVTDVFSYTMADADGATATANLTITITGANDVPVAADDDNAGDAVVEAGVVGNAPDAGDASATGNVLSNDTDVDAGDSQTVTAVTGGSVGAAVSGMYGAVTINADGSWSYTLDNADAQTQALSLGEVVTDVFSYTMADADGATATANLTITITGANDAPVAADDDNAGDAVVEAGVVGNAPDAGDASATGNVLSNDTDVDAGDSQTVTAVTGGSVGAAVSGMYGAVTINADGSWSYALDNADAQTQALSQGQSATDVFTYTVEDADGATATANLTITVTGTSDLAALDDEFTIPEDSTLPGEDLSANDVSTSGAVAGVTLIYAQGLVGPAHGTLDAFNSDGTFDYTPVSNFTGTDSFTYTVSDSVTGETRTATATITVTSSGDAPTDIDLNADATPPATGTALPVVGDIIADFETVDADVPVPGDTFTYALTSAGNTTQVVGTATFSIDASTGELSLSSGSIGANSTFTLTVLTTDADSPTNTYSESIGLRFGTTVGNTLNGTGIDNLMWGLEGNDSLNGLGGNDYLFGQDGNDVLNGGAGDDYLDGGAGSNTASYANATTGVSVDLDEAGQQDTLGDGADTLVNIQNLTGSAFDDTLRGDENGNTISGGLGIDSLYGGAGDDVIAAEESDFIIDGGSLDLGETNRMTVAADFTSGPDSQIQYISNVTFSFAGTLDLSSQSEGFTITGSGGNNTIAGGDGADTISGGAGADTFLFFWEDSLVGDRLNDFNASQSDKFAFQGFNLANQSGAGAVDSVVEITTVGGAGTSIAGADVIRSGATTTTTRDQVDTAAEIDALLAAQNGTFDGGVFFLGYDDSILNNRVALYYDNDADTADGGVQLIAILSSMTSTTTGTTVPLTAAQYELI